MIPGRATKSFVSHSPNEPYGFIFVAGWKPGWLRRTCWKQTKGNGEKWIDAAQPTENTEEGVRRFFSIVSHLLAICANHKGGLSLGGMAVKWSPLAVCFAYVSRWYSTRVNTSRLIELNGGKKCRSSPCISPTNTHHSCIVYEHARAQNCKHTYFTCIYGPRTHTHTHNALQTCHLHIITWPH